MAPSDRLYEICCECRDNEEALERLRKEATRLEEFRRKALKLLERLRADGDLPPWALEQEAELVDAQ